MQKYEFHGTNHEKFLFSFYIVERFSVLYLNFFYLHAIEGSNLEWIKIPNLRYCVVFQKFRTLSYRN